MADRKKNIYDHVAYPPVLYKRAGSAKKTLSSTGDAETPYVGSDVPDPGIALKRQLFQLIIAQKWTNDDQLSDLYTRTREANKHLSDAVVEDAIAFVQYALDHSDS